MAYRSIITTSLGLLVCGGDAGTCTMGLRTSPIQAHACGIYLCVDPSISSRGLRLAQHCGWASDNISDMVYGSSAAVVQIVKMIVVADA